MRRGDAEAIKERRKLNGIFIEIDVIFKQEKDNLSFVLREITMSQFEERLEDKTLYRERPLQDHYTQSRSHRLKQEMGMEK